MVDFATFRLERPFPDLVLKHLRPGDIYTHAFLAAVPMLDAQGKVLPYLAGAKKRGVIFDVGHGAGSLSFRQAIPAGGARILSGLHLNRSAHRQHECRNEDILNVKSKFLNMGMPLNDILAAVTWHPVHEIHHEELGHLSVGAAADVAVLRIEKGNFGFIDSQRRRFGETSSLSPS